ncbi:MAG: TIGR00289 family protein [Nanoarchaeota archaeon]|nr:TIGR00289 family protein [Nanoarchaeota archaeon]
MKLGVLFSGGKDSTYALFKASQEHEVKVLIALRSLNPESYMFHTPAFEIISKQAEALGLPLILVETAGEKEKELKDLEKAIVEAKEKYGIEGIVTGAVASKYQASRIQKICDDLGLECLNPLWQMDQIELLKGLVADGFEVMIVGVAAYPLDEEWLGKVIDNKVIEELIELNIKYKIHMAGEGGEYESLVLDSPIHKKKIKLVKVEKEFSKNSGVLRIIEFDLVEK